MWATDFNGWFRMHDGTRTLSDLASRYLLRCQHVHAVTAATVQPVFVAAFREFGLPAAIRSDMGHHLPRWGKVGCRGWPCGGFAWGSDRNGFSPGTRSKMGGMNACIGLSSRPRATRRAGSGACNNGPSSSFARTIITNGPTRPWPCSPRRTATGARRGRSRAVSMR